jgi:hypothetical protein
MTAVGKDFTAVLSSSMRGPVLTRRAKTRSDAYAQAHALLDQADDMAWHQGETVQVSVAQSEE